MDGALKGKMLSLPVQKSLRVPLIQLCSSWSAMLCLSPSLPRRSMVARVLLWPLGKYVAHIVFWLYVVCHTALVAFAQLILYPIAYVPGS